MPHQRPAAISSTYKTIFSGEFMFPLKRRARHFGD
jgi:hypothetical protein